MLVSVSSLLCSTTCLTKETNEESKYNFVIILNKYRETQVLALDCERVLTDKGERLARVSIVNFYGNIVFDTLVKPCNHYQDDYKVLDYRESITGILPIDLRDAPTFANIDPIVSSNLKSDFL